MVTLLTIKKCGENDETAQRLVFNTYGDLLFGIAYRYLNDKMTAEDAVANAFIKIFNRVGRATFNEVNGFEAWIRRIIINESLTILRQRYRFQDMETLDQSRTPNFDNPVLSEMALQEVMVLVKKLPLGYRTVLNLFAVEGFSHVEISQLLGISIGASKSQLSKARAMLKKKMNQLRRYEYGTKL